MFEKVKLNKNGFYELKNKPSQVELEEYYKNIYYQEAKGSYEKKYTNEELLYINNKLEQKYEIIEELINTNGGGKSRFLDIGCGEGWSLDFFIRHDWEVTGLDFSTYGCNQFNSQVMKNLVVGDIYTNIDKLIKENEKFDCIYMINVLEHVLEPLELLEKCYQLLVDKGVILIQVPNDFSNIQSKLIKSNLIDRPFWVCIPDHISYFSIKGLLNICSEARFESKKVLSDFPMDFNLFNKDTNYVIDESKGKNCHTSRVSIENFLHSISDTKVNKLYEDLAEMGLGRNIIAFFIKD